MRRECLFLITSCFLRRRYRLTQLSRRSRRGRGGTGRTAQTPSSLSLDEVDRAGWEHEVTKRDTRRVFSGRHGIVADSKVREKLGLWAIDAANGTSGLSQRKVGRNRPNFRLPARTCRQPSFDRKAFQLVKVMICTEVLRSSLRSYGVLGTT